MTITFVPATLAFGSVTVHTQGAASLTITNSGSTVAPVNAPGAPFAMEPTVAVVPAAAADGTAGVLHVIVKFVPLGVQPYVGSISCDGVTCALSGAGELATVEETITTKKSLLINVPDFSDGVFEKRRSPDAVEKIMTSFLRLGAFDYAVEPPKAKALLNLIHQAGPPGDPARTEKYGDAWEANPDFLNAPPFQPRASAADAANAGNGDVFFFDDVRIRDVDVGPGIAESSINGHGLTMEQRQAESARLYSRGGWRDHSDGNRISTTYGDKVEVIRGNYKMIVMGRQDDPGEGMGWEASGSHVTDYAPGTMPGATYWHQWVPDYRFTDSEGVVRTGVWLLVNTTENVYEYARYGGNFREERWGDLLETYVGSENPPLGQIATDSLQGTAGHSPPARLAGISYDLPATSPLDDRTTPGWAVDNTDMVRSNPHIVEKTWARRIDSWTGSEICPVDEIHEKTFAHKIYGDTGSAARRISEIHEDTWATDTFETVNVTNKIQGNTVAGSIFEATTAGTIWESTTSLLHTELHVGVHASFEAGAVLDVFAGVKTEIALGWGVAISTSGFEDYDFPFKKALTVEDVKTSLNEVKASLSKTENTLAKRTMALSLDYGMLRIALRGMQLQLGL